MGVAYNPTIPKQGLQFLYDEGNTSKSGLDKDLVSGTSLSFSTNFTQVSEFSNLTKLTAASDVGGSSAPSGSTGLTIVCWNKRTGEHTGTWNEISTFNGSGGGSRYRAWWLGYYTSQTSRIHWSVPHYTADGGTTTSYSSVDPFWSNAGLTHVVGQFYSIICTYTNSSRLRAVYINGRLALSNTRGGYGDINDPAAGGTLRIRGTRENTFQNNQSKFFALYNRPFSEDEVSQVHETMKSRFGY